ncbi:23S rRNA (uracil(1939)-C(5))-methyltransferase RlmD, partial [Candidatus Saccharibacteria bacterium]|nr:23S rRNA (uracil(1939)-C(5))-methyltransferase RlmD [Candidatus Saccharibacteria bacterium]
HNTSKVVYLYSGVGTIGLTIGGDATTLVEIDEHAVREMKENIARLGKTSNAVLAPSEKALDYITEDSLIIVDPPRAGLHDAVAERILEVLPPRIIYLSCNPVTQARDVAILAEKYGIRAHQGYNFFPCTPHIEHLVVLDLKP